MKETKYKQTQAGRSMIEMLGVLAVIGVLTVGGFALVSKATNAHRTNVILDEIGVLANKARRVFHEFVEDNRTVITENAPVHNMTNYVYKAQAYPEGLELLGVSENDYANAYFEDSNDIKMEVKQIRVSQIDYFFLKISQLSDDICMAVAQSSWGSPSINGYIGICADAACEESTLLSSSGKTVRGGAKLSLDEAADACSTETENTVYLIFR